MTIAVESIKIERKAHGHYVIDFATKNDNEPRTVGAAKGSPLAQTIRLLERLLILSDRIAGYNQ